VLGRKSLQNLKRQRRPLVEDISPEYFSIQGISQYLGFKRSTLYSLVEQRSIPYYRVGKLIRFKRSEIDLWMEGNKKDCVAPEKVARKALGPIQKHKIDIDRVVRKAIEGTRGQGYTKPHGKPDQVKGLGKEVHDGSV
jgi:excisionase family DNA binding protein